MLKRRKNLLGISKRENKTDKRCYFYNMRDYVPSLQNLNSVGQPVQLPTSQPNNNFFWLATRIPRFLCFWISHVTDFWLDPPGVWKRSMHRAEQDCQTLCGDAESFFFFPSVHRPRRRYLALRTKTRARSHENRDGISLRGRNRRLPPAGLVCHD